MATTLKDGCHAFLGMAQPVDSKTMAPNGQRFFYAVLASVHDGEVELVMELGRSYDLNTCVLKMKEHRDPGKKRSFLEGVGTLTFEPPTSAAFPLTKTRLGILQALEFQDLSKAQVYLELV